MREFFVRLGLVALSVVVAVGAIEILLRLTYDVEDLYAVFQLKPEIADAGWQRAFVKSYGPLRGSGALVNDLVGYVHDPELGWDVPGRFRHGAPASVEKPDGVFRVLAIGDSYTYGSQVNADQSYSAYLEPVFQLGANGELVLTHTPVPTPDEMYQRLTDNLGPLSYLETLARAAYQTQFAGDEQETYYNKWDPLIERLFVELLNAAREDGSRVLFLYIPTGKQLADEATPENHCCDREHLTNIWKRLARTASFDVIDLTEAMPREYGRDRVIREMQFHYRGRPQGHFTPAGNEGVAKLIVKFLQQQSGIEAPSATANRSRQP